MKLGVQLYGCTNLYRADPEGFLKRIREMGYDVIEPCVVLDDSANDFAWKLADLDRHVALAKRCGLELDSCHVFADGFWTRVSEMLEIARRFGAKRFVVGWQGAVSRAALDAFAAHCMEAADALAAEGCELWLHNVRDEIAARIDGISAYEYILRACGGKLGAQVDTGWAVCGGEEIADFLTRNEKYVRSVHHKDVAAVTDADGNTVNVALGKGIVDVAFPYAFGAKRGLTQIVDQDNSAGDIMEDLRQSVACLRELGR